MSRMPSASPTSQCGFAGNASSRSRSLRTILLSCSSFPGGTSGATSFGIQSARSSRSAVSGTSSVSICLMRSPTSRMRFFTSSLGGPPLLPLFRSACSSSFSLCSLRTFPSSSRSRSSGASKWRAASMARTRAGSSRIRWSTVTVVPLSALVWNVVLVAFEGPDRYSFVGGLATRMNDLSAALAARGLSAPIFWNANNTYGFGRIDFPILRRLASITTISRYMRMELAKVDVEAAILPNGIADRWLAPVPPIDTTALREAFGDRPTFVKVARFDADKRWLWAIDAVVAMRNAGMHPRLVMRGSRSDYADVVGNRIRANGLTVERIALPSAAGPTELAAAIAASTTDVLFLDFFISERTLRALYAAADGVLANSEKEPFGLVGLEVMACGG